MLLVFLCARPLLAKAHTSSKTVCDRKCARLPGKGAMGIGDPRKRHSGPQPADTLYSNNLSGGITSAPWPPPSPPNTIWKPSIFKKTKLFYNMFVRGVAMPPETPPHRKKWAHPYSAPSGCSLSLVLWWFHILYFFVFVFSCYSFVFFVFVLYVFNVCSMFSDFLFRSFRLCSFVCCFVRVFSFFSVCSIFNKSTKEAVLHYLCKAVSQCPRIPSKKKIAKDRWQHLIDHIVQ